MAEYSITSLAVTRSPRRKYTRLSVGSFSHQNGKKGKTDGSETSRSKQSNSKVGNTYKLEPGNGDKFQTEAVRHVMLSTLESKLVDVRYDAATCGSLATLVTNEITSRIKEYHWTRYKFVVQVFVGQKENQGIQVASRCVWNADTDTYACVSYGNSSLFAVASCYAVYYE